MPRRLNEFIVGALFLFLSNALLAQGNAQNIQVFIVAIGQYDADVYPALVSAEARAKDLADFFRSTYRLHDQQIHIYSNKTNNVDEQHLLDLQKDIVKLAENDESVVFLFVLSHGKVLPSREYGLDLLIVASDTPGNANKPTSERVLGSGFFASFIRIGEKSIVYAFFDTCSSGVLEQIGDHFSSTYGRGHKRVVSVASSGANGDSYDFSFTKNLLEHWKLARAKSTLDCEFAANLPGKIPLDNQELTVVLEDKSICMDSINPSQAMLFLVAEDAAPAIVKLFDSKGSEMLPPKMIQENNFLPILQIVKREPIQAELWSSETNNLVWRYPVIDFSTTPIAFIDLGLKHRNAYSNQSHVGGIAFGLQSAIATAVSRQ